MSTKCQEAGAGLIKAIVNSILGSDYIANKEKQLKSIAVKLEADPSDFYKLINYGKINFSEDKLEKILCKLIDHYPEHASIMIIKFHLDLANRINQNIAEMVQEGAPILLTQYRLS